MALAGTRGKSNFLGPRPLCPGPISPSAHGSLGPWALGLKACAHGPLGPWLEGLRPWAHILKAFAYGPMGPWAH